MARAEWVLCGLGALALAPSPSCGGRVGLDVGATGSGGATMTSTEETTGIVGGSSGQRRISVADLCPDLPLDVFECGEDTFTGEALRERGCEFRLQNPPSCRTPSVVVDCAVVDRFDSGDGGAAGQPEVQERWSWDEGNMTLTFHGASCEELQAGVVVVAFGYRCGLVG